MHTRQVLPILITIHKYYIFLNEMFLTIFEISVSLIFPYFLVKGEVNVKYLVSSHYHHISPSSPSIISASTIWKAIAPPKVKILAWIALYERHNITPTFHCIFYHSTMERANHLLLHYPYTNDLATLLLALSSSTFPFFHPRSLAPMALPSYILESHKLETLLP